ncbi:hypothetical protein IG631_04879 [Alternaria alternata]|nr:hypothetical protein IG631_04879 [Alternaria alternata]
MVVTWCRSDEVWKTWESETRAHKAIRLYRAHNSAAPVLVVWRGFSCLLARGRALQIPSISTWRIARTAEAAAASSRH